MNHFEIRALRRSAQPNGKANDWLLWQLADSAFPSGGFAHSAGLEASWQHGQLPTRTELADYLTASLRQCGHASLPFFKATCDAPENLAEIDLQCDAFLSNHVANRASRLQGRAFHASARKIFCSADSEFAGVDFPKLSSCGHFAPVFGAVTSALRISREDAAEIFLFQFLRGLIAAAIRLGIVGPMEGQALQFRLGQTAREILDECREILPDDAAQTAPLMEIWQGTQDRLYSRLFQS